MSEDIIEFGAVRLAEDRRRATETLSRMLIKSDKGVPTGALSNLILILIHDLELRGLCHFNEFRSRSVLTRSPPSLGDDLAPQPGPYPRAWGSADVSLVQSYIQRVWTQQAGGEETEKAMVAAAAINRFHPVRDWLSGLKWDGRPRLDLWLVHCFGAPDVPYARSIAAKILIAAVRRIRQPGCKFDHMLILEGIQGIGKSTCLRKLAGDEWFTDSLPTKLESKEAAIALQGVWIVEFSEIEQLIRSEVEVIKSFLARSIDRYRPPYGKNMADFPRQTIMVGTTNSSDYLRDSSGNRRFWPVRCDRADVEWIVAAREQLWAEAAAREAVGETHWLDGETAIAAAAQEQAERFDADVWTEAVQAHLFARTRVTVPEVLIEALKVPLEKHSKREQMRVASILRQEGWVRMVRWVGGKPIRIWERPDDLTTKTR